ncbi:MAG: hypothetical protein AAFY88_16130, partial [Acidobacteriota bacterium]
VITLDGGGRGEAPRDLVTIEEIEAVLSHHRGEVTVIVDACRDRRPAVSIDVGDLASSRGPNTPLVLWATSPGAAAIESDRLQGSPFTVAVKDYLERAKRRVAQGAEDDCASGCRGADGGGRDDATSTEPGDLWTLDIRTLHSNSAAPHDFDVTFGTTIGDHDFTALWAEDIAMTGFATGLRWPADALAVGEVVKPELDFVAEFGRIAEQTRRLAMDLHGVDQRPEISRGATIN